MEGRDIGEVPIQCPSKQRMKDDLSEEDAVDLAEKSKQRGDEVTPDKMVTCPKCGKHFRVGKKTE